MNKQSLVFVGGNQDGRLLEVDMDRTFWAFPSYPPPPVRLRHPDPDTHLFTYQTQVYRPMYFQAVGSDHFCMAVLEGLGPDEVMTRLLRRYAQPRMKRATPNEEDPRI